ncbi:FAD binding domain-containing protein [Marinobacter sp. JSM 1782161]|uniref:FAD binding domain-containing protein n=1 Tax=Marinobacter sp. JSM 1782161 TaxID=2685906 RepID=UPI0014031330|nr:FAD binding domain-containing protein [Marinobacter sp. JSM 1782161]
MKPQAFDYHRADDLADACQKMTAGEVRPIAGGQSLGPMLNLRLARPDALLDVAILRELRGCQRITGGVLIGAAVTHAEIEDGLVPDNTGGILPRIARGIAYRAVRSRGTIGGSLAHADPAADWITTLTALGAQVILQRPSSRGSARRRMYLDDFVTGAMQTALSPDELLIAVFVPDVAADTRFGYFKLCRKTGELAHAMAAVFRAATGDGQRVVFGALPGAPLLLAGGDALDQASWRGALAERYPDMEEADITVRLHVMNKALKRSQTHEQ